jgi:hypothetical protein
MMRARLRAAQVLLGNDARDQIIKNGSSTTTKSAPLLAGGEFVRSAN